MDGRGHSVFRKSHQGLRQERVRVALGQVSTSFCRRSGGQSCCGVDGLHAAAAASRCDPDNVQDTGTEAQSRRNHCELPCAVVPRSCTERGPAIPRGSQEGWERGSEGQRAFPQSQEDMEASSSSCTQPPCPETEISGEKGKGGGQSVIDKA